MVSKSFLVLLLCAGVVVALVHKLLCFSIHFHVLASEFLQSRRCTCTGLLWSKAVHAIGCAKILPPSRAEENSDVSFYVLCFILCAYNYDYDSFILKNVLTATIPSPHYSSG